MGIPIMGIGEKGLPQTVTVSKVLDGGLKTRKRKKFPEGRRGLSQLITRFWGMGEIDRFLPR